MLTSEITSLSRAILLRMSAKCLLPSEGGWDNFSSGNHASKFSYFLAIQEKQKEWDRGAKRKERRRWEGKDRPTQKQLEPVSSPVPYSGPAQASMPAEFMRSHDYMHS